MFLLLTSLGLHRPACFLILEANINMFEIWKLLAPHGNGVAMTTALGLVYKTFIPNITEQAYRRFVLTFIPCNGDKSLEMKHMCAFI